MGKSDRISPFSYWPLVFWSFTFLLLWTAHHISCQWYANVGYIVGVIVPGSEDNFPLVLFRIAWWWEKEDWLVVGFITVFTFSIDTNPVSHHLYLAGCSLNLFHLLPGCFVFSYCFLWFLLVSWILMLCSICCDYFSPFCSCLKFCLCLVVLFPLTLEDHQLTRMAGN